MAASTIANTCSLIQTVAAGITGVKNAPIATYPDRLERRELPYVLTFPENGVTSQHTFQQNYRITDRNFSVRCYVEPLGQSVTTDKVVEAITLLQSFIEAFETNRLLQDNITIINDILDSGIISGENVITNDLTKMVIAGNLYIGFVLTLDVRMQYGL